MANPYAILNELIRSNSEVATFQKDKLRELSAKDFPFSDSETLIKALKKINEEVLKIFDDLKIQSAESELNGQSGGTQNEEYEEIFADLLSYSKLLWNINTLVYFVEQSAREHVAQSTVFLISYLTRQYTDNSSFLLTPLFEHNFLYRNLGKYIKELIQDSIPNSSAILKDFPENFSILSFPEIHRDNIVANILLAHEVGHFIVNVKGLESKVNPHVKIDSKLFSEYVDKVASSQMEGMKAQRKLSEFFEIPKLQAKISESLTRSIESWIRELLSDMIGFRLSGPVFIFALADELLTMFPHGLASERYPPTSYRLHLILEEIENQKFVTGVTNDRDQKKINDLINRMKDFLQTPSATSQDELLKIVFQAVNEVKPIIKSTVDDAVKGMQYMPEDFAKDVCKLIDKLKDITPPCEINDGEPANIISILNAGMIYKMTWMEEGFYKSSERADIEDTERTINGLVLRSIEMSILEEKMLKHLQKVKPSNTKKGDVNSIE